MFSKFFAFLRLSRPIFLLGGFILYALGALIARYQGYPLNWPVYLVGQLFVTSLQLATHYLNDYWDVEADKLNTTRTWFSGGSGVLSSGELPREVAFNAAIICYALNSGAAIALVLRYEVAPGAWAIMLLAFLGSFFYSAPPARLVNSGYGELTTSVLVAGLVPAFAHIVQAARPSLLVLLATAPLVILHYAMLITFEFPDFLSDEAAGKKTILVRLGRKNGTSLHNALIGLALGLAAVNSFLGLPPRVAISVALTAPLALWQIISLRNLRRGEPVSFQRLTFGAVLLFALTAYFIAFSFWVIG